MKTKRLKIWSKRKSIGFLPSKNNSCPSEPTMQGIEEVYMNWIGRRSVTEKEVSLKWMTINKHF